MNLIDLGWPASPILAAAFAPFAAQGFAVGRIAVELRGSYRVLTETGDFDAQVTGQFRHQAVTAQDFPAVGDWVVLQLPQVDSSALIHHLLPRHSQFVRKAAGTKSEGQVVAANVNTLFLIMGLDDDFNPRRIERYLVMAWESGANPVIVLSKADLCPDLTAACATIEAIALGVPIHGISVANGTGLDALEQYLSPGQTIALVGSSGVGKSTLTNYLIGAEAQATQTVRLDDSKGRHTTTQRHLFSLPSGALLIDTPGMRELQLWSVTEGVTETFSDIEALAEQCKFRDCQHQQEPGCAVQGAIAQG
ncbi:MAG: ribosome small subunit-dependent GTPase A, partial [Leptolyngbyaceae cyanobacterium]